MAAGRPSPRARGLSPTAANGEPTPLLTPGTPGSADSASRAKFCTRERLGSFSAAGTPGPCFRSRRWSIHPSHAGTLTFPPVRRAADRGLSRQQAYGHGGGRNTCQTSAFPEFGSERGQTPGGRAARTPLFAERSSAHPWRREVCRRASLYLQWYFIYSRVCLARAV